MRIVFIRGRAALDVDRAPSCLRRGVALCSDPERFAIQHLGNYRSSVGWFVDPACRSEFCLCSKWRLLPLGCGATRQWKQPTLPVKLPSESFFESFGTIIRYARNAPGFQVVLGRNFLFALFISVIPALMPVVGLKLLHLSSSNLGLLFASMGAGSVIGAVFIIPRLRARLSPDSITFSAPSRSGSFQRQTF
jgi:hypothetical protein